MPSVTTAKPLPTLQTPPPSVEAPPPRAPQSGPRFFCCFGVLHLWCYDAVMQRFTISFEDGVADALRQEAARRRMSVSRVVVEFVGLALGVEVGERPPGVSDGSPANGSDPAVPLADAGAAGEGPVSKVLKQRR